MPLPSTIDLALLQRRDGVTCRSVFAGQVRFTRTMPIACHLTLALLLVRQIGMYAVGFIGHPGELNVAHFRVTELHIAPNTARKVFKYSRDRRHSAARRARDTLIRAVYAQGYDLPMCILAACAFEFTGFKWWQVASCSVLRRLRDARTSGLPGLYVLCRRHDTLIHVAAMVVPGAFHVCSLSRYCCSQDGAGG